MNPNRIVVVMLMAVLVQGGGVGLRHNDGVVAQESCPCWEESDLEAIPVGYFEGIL